MANPDHSLPPEETALIEEAYAEAEVILEYGTGGATWIAARMPGKTISAVESDRSAARQLAQNLRDAGVPSMPMIHWVDIGRVGKWGKPMEPGSWPRFSNYPISPWSLPGFVHPDVVLINGRFRAACFAAVCVNATKPVRVLFDDYANRPAYHIVERLCPPTRTVGRMAEFHIEPGSLSPERLADVLQTFAQASYAMDGEAYLEENAEQMIALSPDRALELPKRGNWVKELDKWAVWRGIPRTPDETRLLGELEKTVFHRNVLAGPYVILLLPVVAPLVLGAALYRRYQRSKVPKIGACGRNAGTGSDGTGAPAAAPASSTVPEEDTFVLYRIVGNDLEPRHGGGQSLRNVRFILDHEPEHEGFRKKWLLNRIYDPVVERQIIELLESRGQDFQRIPFSYDDYARVPFDYSLLPGPDFLTSREFRKMGFEARLRAVVQCYRLKNNHVMNNNGARNTALNAGRSQAKWVLPWDGNCFLSAEAGKELRDTVLSNRHLQYFTVPMARFGSNEELLNLTERPEAREEPQILFRCDAPEAFDPEHPYGRRPKVELLARLGVEGPWKDWHLDPWDVPIRQGAPDPGRVGEAAWVARLASGKTHLERSGRVAGHERTMARFRSIILTLNKLDDEVLRRHAGWYRSATEAMMVGSKTQDIPPDSDLLRAGAF